MVYDLWKKISTNENDQYQNSLKISLLKNNKTGTFQQHSYVLNAAMAKSEKQV